MLAPESDRIIRAFLAILIQESEKEESSIIPPSVWENLDSLLEILEILEKSANDNSTEILKVLLTWCKNHQCPYLFKTLQISKDPTDYIAPRDQNIPINNRYVRSQIRVAQDNKNQKKSSEDREDREDREDKEDKEEKPNSCD